MAERMTWDEISKQYPDQWVGLVDIDWEDEANIRSAVVRYVGLPSSELVRMQINDQSIHAAYTTPDNLSPLGTLGVFG